MKKHEDYFSRYADQLFARCEESFKGSENKLAPKFQPWVKAGLKAQLVDLRACLLQNRQSVSEWFVLDVQLFWKKMFDLNPDISIVQYFYFISQIRDISCAIVETFNKMVVRLFRDKQRAHTYDEGAEDKLRIAQNGQPPYKLTDEKRWVWNIDFLQKADSWATQWRHNLAKSIKEKAEAAKKTEGV